MGMLKFGQTVLRRHNVRSFSSNAAQNETRKGGLTIQGYANLAVLSAPFCYWALYRIDFGGCRTLYTARKALERGECVCCGWREKHDNVPRHAYSTMPLQGRDTKY